MIINEIGGFAIAKNSAKFILTFTLIWLCLNYLIGDSVWMYVDKGPDGELIPDFELKPEIVSDIKVFIALVTNSVIWLLYGVFVLIKWLWQSPKV